MAFEVFEKRLGPSGTRAPSATLLKTAGALALNKAAVDMLSGAKTVKVLYDPDKKIIGLRPGEGRDAYKVRPIPNGNGSAQVTMRSFIHHYGIDVSQSLRMTPFEEGGVLCFDLNKAVPVSRKRRAGK